MPGPPIHAFTPACCWCPTAGSRSAARASERTRRRIHAGLLLVPEGRAVFGRMGVEENLSIVFAPLAAPGRGVYARDEIYDLCPRLKERRQHFGSQLSGGERQMLGIGRALMMG